MLCFSEYKVVERFCMIRIAVCDDKKENLDELCGYMKEYFSQMPDMENKIYRFLSGEKLLKEMKNKRFDLYFLDVLMPDANGMEIGRTIRRTDQDAIIVYVTVSREYAFEAFGVRALQYLQKPVNKAALFELLDTIVHILERQQSCRICIRTKEGLLNVNVSDIMYVENIDRCAVYMLKDGTQVTGLCNRSSFEKSVRPLNEFAEFMQPHKSYFVNMHFIRNFFQKSLELDDGTVIAVSRKRFVNAKKAYLDFLVDKGELI